jgi:hypothetical protein
MYLKDKKIIFSMFFIKIKIQKIIKNDSDSNSNLNYILKTIFLKKKK